MRKNIIAGFAPRALMPRPLWGVLPLAALVLVGMLWSIRARRWRVAALWLAYTAWSAGRMLAGQPLTVDELFSVLMEGKEAR